MSKAVDITGISVRPMPKELFETVACTHCKSRPARWEFAEGPQRAWTFSCSNCFLYEVPQMREQRAQLDSYLEELAEMISTGFPREADGRLREAKDADRAAFGIVMTQRFMQSRTLRGGFG
jgi:hypothetical protein